MSLGKDPNLEIKILKLEIEERIKRTKLMNNFVKRIFEEETIDSNEYMQIMGKAKKIINAQKKEDKIYKKYYSYSSLERYAKIKVKEELILLFDLMKDNLISLFETYALREFLLNNYKSLAPTIYYLKKCKKDKKQIKLIEEESKSLNIEERLRLGLRLTKNEYQLMHNQLLNKQV